MKTFNKIIAVFFIMMFIISGNVLAASNTSVPTITPSIASGSEVKAGEALTLTISGGDDAAIQSCVYAWNDDQSMTSIFDNDSLRGQEGLLGSINYTFKSFPKVYGENVLRIVVSNEYGTSSGVKVFKYQITDQTAPTVTANKASGVIDAGATVKFTVKDDAALKSIKYYMNGTLKALDSFEEGMKSYEITAKIFDAPGKYECKIAATDMGGNITTKTFIYTVEDNVGPTITSSVKNNTDIQMGSKVEFTVEDENGLDSIEYTINGGDKVVVLDSSNAGKYARYEITLSRFSNVGKNIVKLTAKDVSGNITNETFTYNVYSNDSTAPVITLNPVSGSVVEPGARIQMTVTDNESKITSLKYNWENATESNLIPGKKEPANNCQVTLMAIGTKAGTYRLHVTAVNSVGKEISEVYTYIVKGDEPIDEPKDETKPTVSANPSSGTIDPYEKIAVTAKDNEALKSLTYNWNSDSSKTVTVTGTEDTINVTAPSKSGTHTLYVTVKDEAGNQATASFTYKITETDKPSVVADPESGKIEPSSIIELTARDNEALKSLTYNWDSNSSKTVTISGTKDTVNVSAPSGAGKHILYVTVKDASNNSIEEDFVYTIADNEKPTVTVKPNGGEVNAGDTVTITGKDNEGLDKITYNWDDESPVKKSVSGKEATVETEVPNEPGKHTLYVTVEDEDGNKVTDSVDFTVKDDEAPTITVSPKSGSTVKGGKVVKATLKDDVQLKKVTYHWDDDADTTKSISGTSKTIDLPKLPYKEGTYKVKITVEDEAGNVTKGTFTYYVEDDDDEGEYPTVDADPDGGEVEYGDKITITAEDEDGEIEYVEYYWDDDDDDTTKKYKDKFTVKVPSEEGKHYLYVRAMDNDDNLCDYERFIYYVEEDNYPGNSDIVGDINSRVKSLRVEIRNADDKIRFEPDEDILYYVDYYNGTSSKVTNAKLVVDLPTYLEADKASDSGKITTKQVTWSLGTLNAGEYGRVSFVAHYTSSKVNEKIITVPAKIYSGSSLKDTSTVRNLIFCVGASGSGSHQAYCVGYPDGTFLPEGKITRAELASMICNIEGLTYSTNRTTQFTDANDHWAKNYMQTVVDKGYMKPKSYNYFGAQDYATRGDLAYAIAAILDVEDLEPVFISATDTKNSDVRCAMEQLLRLGIMDGYSDGTAKPNSSITRAEAVTIINNYLFRGELYTKGYNYAYNFETNYTHGGNSYILRFTDLSSNHWAYGHIMEATNNHRYERVMDGNEEML